MERVGEISIFYIGPLHVILAVPHADLRAFRNIMNKNHARLWSPIASAERHGVDPQRYLTSVLAKIGQTPAEELDQFLADGLKAEDAAQPLPTGE